MLNVRYSALLILLALFGLRAGPASAGVVIVNNDDWTLSQSGFDAANASTTAFVQNILNLFTDGQTGGNFLAYTSSQGSPGLTDASLQETVVGTGATWTVSNTVPFTLQSLLQYNGVFLTGPTNFSVTGCGTSPTAPVCGYPDNQVLIDYVNAGGNVYVGAGLEWNPDTEQTVWGQFLNAFGLGYSGGTYNGVSGLVDVSSFASQSPLFDSVTDLLFDNGDNVTLTDPSNSNAQVFSVGGNALFGLYEARGVPEPSTGFAFLMGLLTLGLLRSARVKGMRQ